MKETKNWVLFCFLKSKEKREKAKISKIRNERGEIITYATAIQKKS